MNICIVSQYFWPESFRINDLAYELHRRGHRVQILTGQPNYPGGAVFPGYGGIRARRSAVAGNEVLRVPIVPRRSGTGRRLAINYLSFAAAASAIGVVGIRGPIDIVLAYEPSPLTVALPALLLGKRFKVPVLLWIQDLWPDTLQATGALRGLRTVRWADAACGLVHRSMDGLLIQSPAFAPKLERQGVRPDRVTEVPNWAEDSFRPLTVGPDAPERAELPPEGFVVMFAGSLGLSQGLEVLIDAAELLRDLPDLHLVVLGDGRQANWLRGEVERRKLDHVHLLGQRPVETMPTWFALADALLVTLKPHPLYSLTIPSKVQAYLACGRPILASLDGVGADVVERARAGFTCAAGDGAGLAAIMRKLYDTGAADRTELGANGRRCYERDYARDTLVARIENALASAQEAAV